MLVIDLILSFNKAFSEGMPKPLTRQGGRAEGRDKTIINEESYHQAKHPQRRISSIKTVEERQQQDGPNCR